MALSTSVPISVTIGTVTAATSMATAHFASLVEYCHTRYDGPSGPLSDPAAVTRLMQDVVADMMRRVENMVKEKAAAAVAPIVVPPLT